MLHYEGLISELLLDLPLFTLEILMAVAFISDKTHLQNVFQRTLSILFPTRRYCFNTESLNDQSLSPWKDEFYLLMFLCLTRFTWFCYLLFSNALACSDFYKEILYWSQYYFVHMYCMYKCLYVFYVNLLFGMICSKEKLLLLLNWLTVYTTPIFAFKRNYTVKQKQGKCLLPYVFSNIVYQIYNTDIPHLFLCRDVLHND